MVIGSNMSGKGAKGLLMGKSSAAATTNNTNKDKDKKKPVSRSSRAGLHVGSFSVVLGPSNAFIFFFILFLISFVCYGLLKSYGNLLEAWFVGL